MQPIPAEPPILRDRIAAELQHGQPMTARQLATRLLPADRTSAYSQTRRALNQLEAAGTAERQHGRPWATPDQWRLTLTATAHLRAAPEPPSGAP
jgi:hypothetical protein